MSFPCFPCLSAIGLLPVRAVFRLKPRLHFVECVVTASANDERSQHAGRKLEIDLITPLPVGLIEDFVAGVE